MKAAMNDGVPGGTPLTLPMGPFPPMSEAERARRLAEIRAAAPGGDEVGVFAYGSLMWDPCFDYRSRQVGTLRGHRRSFCLWTARARGSPEAPGLGLGIVAGAGRCEGLVYRLDRAAFEAALPELWEREMYSGVYRPRWLEVACEAGAAPALAFVIDTGHAQYAGEMALEAKARLIAHAHGRYGLCRDYLAKTARALAEHGIDDTEVATLDRMVAAEAP
jgi:cation transport protein ChaC